MQECSWIVHSIIYFVELPVLRPLVHAILFIVVICEGTLVVIVSLLIILVLLLLLLDEESGTSKWKGLYIVL